MLPSACLEQGALRATQRRLRRLLQARVVAALKQRDSNAKSDDLIPVFEGDVKCKECSDHAMAPARATVAKWRAGVFVNKDDAKGFRPFDTIQDTRYDPDIQPRHSVQCRSDTSGSVGVLEILEGGATELRDGGSIQEGSS